MSLSAPSDTPDTIGDAPEITLDDLREALFNGEAHEKTDFDVFEEIAKDKKGLVKRVLQNQYLLDKVGNPDDLLYQLDMLQQRYSREIQTLEAAKSFEQKIEKQSWGKWAIEKIKSVAMFPVRHWKITLFLVLAAVGVAGYYYWPQIIGLAQGVWEARGLAAAGEVAEVAEAGTALEAPSALEGIGSGAAAVPEGLAPAVPPGASSAGFPMNVDPGIPRVPLE